MRRRVYHIIFEHDTRAGKLFDVVLLWLILFSVIIVILESIPAIHFSFFLAFYSLEWIFTILFTIEYLLRIWSSPKPLKYIFSFWGLVDFLAILPTYIDLILVGYHYLQTVRIFRLLRVFRILKLVRFNTEAQILLKALKSSSYKISIFLMTVLSTVTILGTLMYVVEGSENGFTSIPLSIYWAIVTITTVGFGDIVPQTVIGKFLSSIAMIVGYAIIAVPTGIITVELSKSQRKTSICNNCESPNSNNARYCDQCGRKMGRDT